MTTNTVTGMVSKPMMSPYCLAACQALSARPVTAQVTSGTSENKTATDAMNKRSFM